MARSLLLVLGLLILASMGAGVLIGLQVTDEADSPARVQTATNLPNGSTPTPVPGPDQTQDQTTQITPRPPDRQLQNVLLSAINDYRIRHNRSSITNTEAPSARLKKMATNHSQHMATVGSARISLRGSTSSERYRDAGLIDVCPFPSNSGYSTINPSVGELELVANPIKSPPYENVEAGYNGDMSKATDKALSTWIESNQDRRKLLYKNAEQAGIGTVITDSGSVYITVSLCGA